MHASSDSPDTQSVRRYLLGLQERICRELAEEDGTADFGRDEWSRENADKGGTAPKRGV